jgi:hypothetical protein
LQKFLCAQLQQGGLDFIYRAHVITVVGVVLTGKVAENRYGKLETRVEIQKLVGAIIRLQ